MKEFLEISEKLHSFEERVQELEEQLDALKVEEAKYYIEIGHRFDLCPNACWFGLGEGYEELQNEVKDFLRKHGC